MLIPSRGARAEARIRQRHFVHPKALRKVDPAKANAEMRAARALIGGLPARRLTHLIARVPRQEQHARLRHQPPRVRTHVRPSYLRALEGRVAYRAGLWAVVMGKVRVASEEGVDGGEAGRDDLFRASEKTITLRRTPGGESAKSGEVRGR